jgi:ABC-type lipoprotein export system ATPase subunit
MMTDFKYVPRMLAVRAIFYNPKLILADEPTGNLHSSQGEEIIQPRDGWIVNR